MSFVRNIGLSLAVWITIYAGVSCMPSSVERTGRALLQFGNMIKCITRRSAFDFNGYGCWCGKGGEGTPVDGIDRCCETHDKCYQTWEPPPWKCLWGMYWTFYSYTCSSGTVTCNDPSNTCDYKLCTCDKAMVDCISRQRYNQRYSPDNMDEELCTSKRQLGDLLLSVFGNEPNFNEELAKAEN